ncbi:primary-amine oxidase [Bradyrhizobium sp. 183]|uniref:primary-amine oxidase n=1 Tax=unclassified Bradyrhizobium TaxID=2631580 RepID=UPI001FFF61D6|nr:MULTISPECIES: primary-amine oxidase [unclassified Bradyrhizobium]UPJ79778.1 primary-amine oxidase [Bradyrhizobium sp. 184]UPJ87573.1 primary-amine oxidase [Bradyrhizobium sp. 183]
MNRNVKASAQQETECGCTKHSGPGTAHPLDPLSKEELLHVFNIVRTDPNFGPDYLFETVELHEPDKRLVRAFQANDAINRQARANLFRADRDGVWRLIVSLNEGRVLKSEHVANAKPIIQLEQFLAIEDAVRGSPEFIVACKRRGIEDMSNVCIDPWSAGEFGVSGEDGKHIAHVFAWLRLRENENFYAHPIGGLNAIVDIKTSRVLRVDDHEIIPIPMQESNYESQFVAQPRRPYKPINILQPEGVSFKLDGHRLTWDKWSLRVGFNSREGLTIHDVSYEGRPIVYRASLVEMVVPYGTPDHGHFRKSAFDVGEYGIGKLANSLKLGCDCLGSIQYLDAHMATMVGDVYSVENAICIHEEDAGLLWKHWDFRTDRVESRRARRLVVSSICTVANYEYGLFWYFHTNGTIEMEMKATGIINTAACHPGKPGPYGKEVSPGVLGHIHQHIFCARLDMAVDGDRNRVVELNTKAVPAGPDNPYGNAFYEEEAVLPSELLAGRKVNQQSHRAWKVVSSDRKNHVGLPTGYKLEATHPVTPFVSPDSPTGKRATFAENQVWVTAFDADERYPAGEFMNRSNGTGGVADFVKKDRSLIDKNVVLWHTFGVHHQVRPEDFPVQPCIPAGFKLMPSGFFDRNPGIDLVPDTNSGSCHAKASA